MNEAFFPDKYDTEFSTVFKEFVEKHSLGQSHGGQAWVIHKGTYVWRAWFDDHGFERYLKYIETAPSSSHLPRLLSKLREEPVQFKGMPKGKTVKYIKIEKLTPIPPGNLSMAIDALGFANIKPSDIPDNIADLLILSSKFETTGHPGGDVDHKAVRDAILRHPGFFLLVLDLMKHHNANDIYFDNVLLRGSVPVIVDPFSSL